MSISSAPNATASSTSRSLTASGDWPDGNAVATEATFTPRPAHALDARPGTRFGYTQIAAQLGIDGSAGSGWIAFAASAATLPGVSAPSSVVRSIIRTASSSACELGLLLDRALGERRGALLERDLVDRADARQPRLERQLEAAGQDLDAARSTRPTLARRRSAYRSA